jgi:hypothetical protein
LANRFKQHRIAIESCKTWNLTSFVIGLHVEFVRWMQCLQRLICYV